MNLFHREAREEDGKGRGRSDAGLPKCVDNSRKLWTAAFAGLDRETHLAVL